MKQWGRYLINTSDILRYAWCVRCYRYHCNNRSHWLIQWQGDMDYSALKPRDHCLINIGNALQHASNFQCCECYWVNAIIHSFNDNGMVLFASTWWYPSNENSLFVSFSMSPFPVLIFPISWSSFPAAKYHSIWFSETTVPPFVEGTNVQMLWNQCTIVICYKSWNWFQLIERCQRWNRMLWQSVFVYKNLCYDDL